MPKLFKFLRTPLNAGSRRKNRQAPRPTAPVAFPEASPPQAPMPYDAFLVTLGQPTRPAPLTIEDVAAEARRLDVPRANLLTILSVESNQAGFHQHSNGLWYPTARYEAHKGGKFTDYMFVEEAPDMFRRRFSAQHGNISQEGHYRRMSAAMEMAAPFFGREPIIRATSWGLGQIMGFNARYAGKATPQRLAEEAALSNVAQLGLFTAFIENAGIRDELAVVNPQYSHWAAFARQYNGPQNVDAYARRCARAYHTIIGNGRALS